MKILAERQCRLLQYFGFHSFHILPTSTLSLSPSVFVSTWVSWMSFQSICHREWARTRIQPKFCTTSIFLVCTTCTWPRVRLAVNLPIDTRVCRDMIYNEIARGTRVKAARFLNSVKKKIMMERGKETSSLSFPCILGENQPVVQFVWLRGIQNVRTTCHYSNDSVNERI